MPAASAARSARPRVVPRRRSPGPSGIHWERVGRLALLFVLGAIVLLYIPPVTHWLQQSSTAARGRAQVEQLTRDRAQLRARLRALTGPGAVEREARRLGMVGPGERAYVVELPSR